MQRNWQTYSRRHVMLLRIAPWFSGEVVVYESLIPGGTVRFMIDGEGQALNKSLSLCSAWVVPVYSKVEGLSSPRSHGPLYHTPDNKYNILAPDLDSIYQSRDTSHPLGQVHLSTTGVIQGNTECTICMIKYLNPSFVKNFCYKLCLNHI